MKSKKYIINFSTKFKNPKILKETTNHEIKNNNLNLDQTNKLNILIKIISKLL